MGFVFLLSCGLAAGILAIHENGGFARLFGPKLADYDPDAPPAPPLPSSDADASTAGPRGSLGGASAGGRPRSGVSGAAGKAPSRGKAKQAVIAVDRSTAAAALGDGTLIVRCNRPCRVSVDGTILGEAAPVLRKLLVAGDHEVRVELLGGDDLAVRRVIVAPGRARELSFTLGGPLPVEDFQDMKGTEAWE